MIYDAETARARILLEALEAQNQALLRVVDELCKGLAAQWGRAEADAFRYHVMQDSSQRVEEAREALDAFDRDDEKLRKAHRTGWLCRGGEV